MIGHTIRSLLLADLKAVSQSVLSQYAYKYVKSVSAILAQVGVVEPLHLDNPETEGKQGIQ